MEKKYIIGGLAVVGSLALLAYLKPKAKLNSEGFFSADGTPVLSSNTGVFGGVSLPVPTTMPIPTTTPITMAYPNNGGVFTQIPNLPVNNGGVVTATPNWGGVFPTTPTMPLPNWGGVITTTPTMPYPNTGVFGGVSYPTNGGVITTTPTMPYPNMPLPNMKIPASFTREDDFCKVCVRYDRILNDKIGGFYYTKRISSGFQIKSVSFSISEVEFTNAYFNLKQGGCKTIN